MQQAAPIALICNERPRETDPKNADALKSSKFLKGCAVPFRTRWRTSKIRQIEDLITRAAPNKIMDLDRYLIMDLVIRLA